MSCPELSALGASFTPPQVGSEVGAVGIISVPNAQKRRQRLRGLGQENMCGGTENKREDRDWTFSTLCTLDLLHKVIRATGRAEDRGAAGP